MRPDFRAHFLWVVGVNPAHGKVVPAGIAHELADRFDGFPGLRTRRVIGPHGHPGAVLQDEDRLLVGVFVMADPISVGADFADFGRGDVAQLPIPGFGAVPAFDHECHAVRLAGRR